MIALRDKRIINKQRKHSIYIYGCIFVIQLLLLVKYRNIAEIGVDILIIDDNLEIAFVSCFFPLKNAMHTLEEYKSWLDPFIKMWVEPVYIFTPRKTQDKYFTNTSKYIRFINKYNSAYDIECNRGYKKIYQDHHELDTRKEFHKNTELYAIWNGKFYLMKLISEMHPRSFVFWLDIGVLREKIYHSNLHFYDRTKILTLIRNESNTDIIFCVIRSIKLDPWMGYENVPQKYRDFIIAGFFGIKANVMKQFYYEYWNIIREYLNYDKFIGQEQNIMDTFVLISNMSFKLYPLFHSKKYDDVCSRWFLYVNQFSYENPCNFSDRHFIDIHNHINEIPLSKQNKTQTIRRKRQSRKKKP